MIPRPAASTLQRLAAGFPVLAMTGPRQSGQTTLARVLFSGKAYVSLENPEEREFAQTDPKRFLARFTDGALVPQDWFANYVATYVERDVRQILAVQDLSQFHRFVRMCAGRSGQLLNLAALGADCGISAVTAAKWLSVLETSYLMFRLQPHHRNFGKRLVKTPKLYCLDVGLMAWLLGIRDVITLQTHPARGAIFETWVISELVKHRLNAGRDAALFFWRDSLGHEVDVLLETPEGLQGIEIKSGATFATDWPQAIHKWAGLSDLPTLPPRIIYGGDGHYERQGCQVSGWREFALDPATA